jgi:hypothetical protein
MTVEKFGRKMYTNYETFLAKQRLSDAPEPSTFLAAAASDDEHDVDTSLS